MKSVSFYHTATGALNGAHFTGSDEAILLNTPADHAAIGGHLDAAKFKVDVTTGKVVPRTDTPPDPDARFAPLRLRKATLQTIADLERSQHRAVRELLVGTSVGAFDRLRAIDEQIALLRAKL